MGGEGMPEGVRGYALFYACHADILADDIPDPSCTDTPAVFI